MADVAPSRQNIEVEEVRAEAAASEGTMTKIGGAVNFWNTFFTGPRVLCANGQYDNGVVPETLVDGFIACESKCEIYAFAITNFDAGISGTTEIDIVCHPANGDPSYSIFSTKPLIPSTASHTPFAAIVQTFAPTVATLRASTGTTVAVLATPNEFQAGDIFTLSFINKQSQGKNCSVQLSLRPLE